MIFLPGRARTQRLSALRSILEIEISHQGQHKSIMKCPIYHLRYQTGKIITALKNSHYYILTFRKNKKKYPVNMNAVTGSKFVCNKNNRTFYHECRKDVFKIDFALNYYQ